MKYIIGIDEVGRGPLAGPVTVGAFWAPLRMRARLVRLLGGRIRDSKQLTPIRRYAIYRTLCKLKKKSEINFSVTHVSNKFIDKNGISTAIQKGINESLKRLRQICGHKNIVNLKLRLDGLLKAPKEYKNQKTIIKGDAKDVFIACASIVAKVRRDALMCRLAKKYPKYGFEMHKGYGTKNHRKMIKKYGISNLHRLSFCASMGLW